ncbi:hypothetical protein AcV7_003613 [Taiwanofungus camphoratus]|nr:hypothetical protein AcV7_003613 [Antrodia cinnamomea]
MFGTPRQPYQWRHPRPYPGPRGVFTQPQRRRTVTPFPPLGAQNVPRSPNHLDALPSSLPGATSPATPVNFTVFPRRKYKAGQAAASPYANNWQSPPVPSAAGPSRVRDEAVASRRPQPTPTLDVPEPDVFEVLEGEPGPGDEWYTAAMPWDDDLVFNGPLNDEDRIMVKYLKELRIDKVVKDQVAAARNVVDRAAAETPRRRRRMARRDALVEKLAAEEDREAQIREEAEEQARLQEEQAREEAHRAEIAKLQQQRMKEEHERREAARKAREEAARKAREEAIRKAEELRRHFEEMERQRQERERREREEAERRERQRQEEIRRLQEEARKAQEEIAQAHAFTQFFALYDAKWAELRRNPNLRQIALVELPWPVFCQVGSAADITLEGVQEFVFHPLRQSLQNKSRKERIRSDILKWHPDKFNTTTLTKVRPWEKEIISEAAGLVARFLNQIMEQEVEREHQGQ